jgi:hypothetical protein
VHLTDPGEVGGVLTGFGLDRSDKPQEAVNTRVYPRHEINVYQMDRATRESPKALTAPAHLWVGEQHVVRAVANGDKLGKWVGRGFLAIAVGGIGDDHRMVLLIIGWCSLPQDRAPLGRRDHVPFLIESTLMVDTSIGHCIHGGALHKLLRHNAFG